MLRGTERDSIPEIPLSRSTSVIICTILNKNHRIDQFYSILYFHKLPKSFICDTHTTPIPTRASSKLTFRTRSKSSYTGPGEVIYV
jgi:hypothetical protein